MIAMDRLVANKSIILVALSVILAVTLFVNSYFIFFAQYSFNNSYLKALFIDALYNSLPNKKLTKFVNETLTKIGYQVYIYRGKDVTVDLLKHLEEDFSLLILRMHSGLSKNNELNLFTSEPYSVLKYVEEQILQTVGAAVAGNETHPIFTINHKFIDKYMQGKLRGTTVIVTGCETAQDPRMITAFLEGGAQAYIGWNGPVLLSHSDRGIEVLIENIYQKKFSLEEAVQNVNLKVGKDPFFETELTLYNS